jgi:hypothetical protein
MVLTAGYAISAMIIQRLHGASVFVGIDILGASFVGGLIAGKTDK